MLCRATSDTQNDQGLSLFESSLTPSRLAKDVRYTTIKLPSLDVQDRIPIDACKLAFSFPVVEIEGNTGVVVFWGYDR